MTGDRAEETVAVEHDEDDWCNVEADATCGTGDATARVLRSVAKTLENAPEQARYDFELKVNERE